MPVWDDVKDGTRNALSSITSFIPDRQAVHNALFEAMPFDMKSGQLTPAGKKVAGLIAGMTGTALAADTAVPSVLYHVAGESYKPGNSLISLYKQIGNEAYDAFAKRWPDSGDLAATHAHQIFVHDNLPDAFAQADYFGGSVLKVDPSKVDGLFQDTAEGVPYWVTHQDVPAAALKPVE